MGPVAMSKFKDALMFEELDTAMDNVLHLQYQAFHTYAFLGLKLLEDADALEEAGIFLCALSEEKEESYLQLNVLLINSSYQGLVYFVRPDPDLPKWEGALKAMEYVLKLESELVQAVKILSTIITDFGNLELYNLIRTHFLDGEQKVLEEMQAHLGTVRSQETQKEQSQRLQCSLQPKD